MKGQQYGDISQKVGRKKFTLDDETGG